jgi:hypothetical protein
MHSSTLTVLLALKLTTRKGEDFSSGGKDETADSPKGQGSHSEDGRSLIQRTLQKCQHRRLWASSTGSIIQFPKTVNAGIKPPFAPNESRILSWNYGTNVETKIECPHGYPRWRLSVLVSTCKDIPNGVHIKLLGFH